MFQYAFLYSEARNKGTDFYFQDEWFFEEHAEAIRALYSSDIPDRIDAVAIHVRRGDYVNNPFYVDLAADGYYERAMAEFPEGTEFLVFSDDIDWCMKSPIFDGKFISFCTVKDEVESMNMMAACKAHIIANSSFSWWGAWLSPKYPDNKVIAPAKWYSDGVERTVLPKHWKKVC